MRRLDLVAVLFIFSVGCSDPDPEPTPDAGPSEVDAGTSGDAGTVPPRGWSPQLDVGLPRNEQFFDVQRVDVDLNAGGTAIAAWTETGNNHGSVWTAWYRAGHWQPPVQVFPANVYATSATVALNDSGSAVIAWVQEMPDGGDAVWARRWVNGDWLAPERLTPALSGQGLLQLSQPSAGIDAQGRALVVWDQYELGSGPAHVIQASRFEGAGWTSQRVSEGTLSATAPVSAVSASGRAVVVWAQGSMSGRVFDGSQWLPSARFAESSGAQRPQVAIDAAGRAFALWEGSTSTGARVVSVRFEPGSGSWSEPSVLTSTTSVADTLAFVSIATDNQGNALALWEGGIGDDEQGMAARFSAAAGTWSPADSFETDWDVGSIQAAMDGAGVGWALYTIGNTLSVRRHTPESGWGPAQRLGDGDATDARANATGMVVMGAVRNYYVSTPAFITSAGANVYVP